MSIIISRLKEKFFYWLWCIDSVSLSIILFLFAIGCFDLLNSIPILSNRLQMDSLILFKKHLIFTLGGITIMLLLSAFSFKRNIKFIKIFFIFSLFLCLLVIFLGKRINGSKRWLNIFGFSIQPSLFIKDTLSIVLPYIFHDYISTIGLLFMVLILLLLEPDLGITILCLSTFIIQLFISGHLEKIFQKYKKIFYCIIPLVIIFMSFKGKYILLRVNKFLSKNGAYQSNVALWNLQNTNFFSGGDLPLIPEAHCDFIFVSIMSNSGIFMGILVNISFLILFVRNINHAQFFFGKKKYIIYGIMSQMSNNFIFHALSNLGFIPSKGIGCPFLSFGGCGILSISISCGILLSITKKIYQE
ncbi:hypothetical protein AB836_01135 [Rickettsiales bacterium (ex Bugula neritina AB1)]|nr:hypothetical protein AB836_01135 [Rickettsiales bacterium (ex Bugula neritina AB1)]